MPTDVRGFCQTQRSLPRMVTAALTLEVKPPLLPPWQCPGPTRHRLTLAPVKHQDLENRSQNGLVHSPRISRAPLLCQEPRQAGSPHPRKARGPVEDTDQPADNDMMAVKEARQSGGQAPAPDPAFPSRGDVSCLCPLSCEPGAAITPPDHSACEDKREAPGRYRAQYQQYPAQAK
ncbi:hypothetical protein TREES_T100009957 [Tupaia chinensis]|uniref:Uncharacterized protein n=1 Tax=Tupaia chinensis TaxID=246437 RepID=L9KLR9_TUPCH|nr:hypothetical protein TREES_T100009957 [Tupaia chinensis]